MITLTQAMSTARKLMDEHGLTDWNICFEPRDVSHVAQCRYAAKIISFNTPYLKKLNDKEFHHVVLHEIAHELDYQWNGNRGHGKTFRETCARIGCIYDGTKMFSVENEPKNFAIVLFAATKAFKKRESDVYFEPPFQTMKAVPMTLWNDYDTGRITYDEFKEIA